MASKQAAKQVDLFYLGGMNDDSGPQYMISGGDVMTVPPVGESIRVPLYVAQDLMGRYNVKGNVFLSLTKNPVPEITDQTKQKVLTTMTRDELLQALSNLPPEKPEVQPSPDTTVLDPVTAAMNAEAHPDKVHDTVTDYLKQVAKDVSTEEDVHLDEPDTDPATEDEPDSPPSSEHEPEKPVEPKPSSKHTGKNKSATAK